MVSGALHLAAVAQANADDPALLLDEARRPAPPSQVEAGERLRLVAQEIEEVPLRHHRDERRRRMEVRQIADRPFAAGDPQLARCRPCCAAASGSARASRAGRGSPSSTDGPCRRGNRGRNRRASRAPARGSRRARTAGRPSSPPGRRRRRSGRSRHRCFADAMASSRRAGKQRSTLAQRARFVCGPSSSLHQILRIVLRSRVLVARDRHRLGHLSDDVFLPPFIRASSSWRDHLA